MEQYIPKSAIVAKLKRRREEWSYGKSTEAKYKSEECDDILSIISNLEVKEVDFEREMQAFAKINLEPLVISDSNIGISISMSQLYNCAKHFFGLGLKAQKGE